MSEHPELAGYWLSETEIDRLRLTAYNKGYTDGYNAHARSVLAWRATNGDPRVPALPEVQSPGAPHADTTD